MGLAVPCGVNLTVTVAGVATLLGLGAYSYDCCGRGLAVSIELPCLSPSQQAEASVSDKDNEAAEGGGDGKFLTF